MFKIKEKSFSITLSLLCLNFLLANLAKADWESTLKSHFDIVDTFDNLQDWSANGLNPSSANGDSRAYDLSLLPKKLDGSNSIWQYWANKFTTAIVTINSGTFNEGDIVANGKGTKLQFRQIYNLEDGNTYMRFIDGVSGSYGNFSVGDTLTDQTTGATATITAWPQIIADHGSAFDWRATGKSLQMNLGDNDNANGAMAGIGAQRLGTYFGDGTPKSGYKKIYIFMMVKFSPTFFGISGAQTDINYMPIFKFLDMCSGFRDINHFGSLTDQTLIDQTSPQTTAEYGANSNILDLLAGGSSWAGRVISEDHLTVATQTPGSNPAVYFEHDYLTATARNNDANYSSSGMDWNKVYSNGQAAGEWFGLEIASDIGTVNNSDGTTDIWLYDKFGNIKGHYSATGQAKLTIFDHYYNKVTLGGNVLSGGTATSATDGRYWIDDFIINGSRIGPNYFSLLNSQATTYDLADFLNLNNDWFKNQSASDIDASGKVNTQDLGIMMSKWN